ncbi:MAG: choice-of-anchor D domain-containing protein [Thermoproteota archaeon]|nr:choice-of-anchor D domain-containing protein [Thermoproteota archaeon]
METIVPDTTPKIQVTPPNTLDFGTTTSTYEQTVTIENIGTGVLNLRQVRFTNTSSPAFGLAGLTPSRSFQVQPHQRFIFQVRFQATQAGIYNNTLAIESNDPQTLSYRLYVRGTRQQKTPFG